MRTSTRQRNLTRLMAAALGVVFASSASIASAQFLWCPGMQEARLSCCCPEVEHDRDVMRAPCCEEQASLSPDSTHGHESTPRVLAAQAAAQVADLRAAIGAHLSLRSPRLVEARAGPSTRLYAKNSIYLL